MDSFRQTSSADTERGEKGNNMTLNGAIMQLVELSEHPMMPAIFRPAIQKVIETISELEENPEPHWIPVTEDTLPQLNKVVVVCGDKGTWDVGRYRGYSEITGHDNINLWNWKNNTLKSVYWWMYKEDALPEPTKG